MKDLNELDAQIGLTPEKARVAFQAESAKIPKVSTYSEMTVLSEMSTDAWIAARTALPCVAAPEMKVALTPDFCYKLEGQTMEKAINVRPISSTNNKEDLKRMMQRGICKLDNVKGAMLLVKRGNIWGVADGLHSLRSYLEYIEEHGVTAPYLVRVRFPTGKEAAYWEQHGDGHFRKRDVKVQTKLEDSKGNLLVGEAKKYQFGIAKSVCSFRQHKYGCDYPAASDEVEVIHKECRKHIEFVVSHPWLSKDEKNSYRTKPYIMAVFVEALATYPKERKAVEQFIKDYAEKNYSHPNPHVRGLLKFLENSMPTKVDEKTGKTKVLEGQQQTAYFVKGASYWLHRYITGQKATTGTGNLVKNDTSVFHLAVPASTPMPSTQELIEQKKD